MLIIALNGRHIVAVELHSGGSQSWNLSAIVTGGAMSVDGASFLEDVAVLTFEFSQKFVHLVEFLLLEGSGRLYFDL